MENHLIPPLGTRLKVSSYYTVFEVNMQVRSIRNSGFLCHMRLELLQIRQQKKMWTSLFRHSSYVLSLFSNIPRLLFSNGDFYVTVHMIFFQSDSRQTKQDNRTNLNGTPCNLLSTNPNPIRNNNFPDIIFKRTLYAKNVQKKQANNSKVELFHRFGYYYFTMHFEFPIQKLTSKTLLAIWFTDSCKNGHPI